MTVRARVSCSVGCGPWVAQPLTARSAVADKIPIRGVMARFLTLRDVVVITSGSLTGVDVLRCRQEFRL